MFVNQEKLISNSDQEGGKDEIVNGPTKKKKRVGKAKPGGGLLKNLRLSFRSKKGNKKQQQEELFNTKEADENQSTTNSIPNSDEGSLQHSSYRGRLSIDPGHIHAPKDLSETDDSVFVNNNNNNNNLNSEHHKFSYFQAFKEHFPDNLQNDGVICETTTITSVNTTTAYHQKVHVNQNEIEHSRSFQSEDIFKTVQRSDNLSTEEMGFLRKKSKKNENDTISQSTTRSRSNSTDSTRRKWSLKSPKIRHSSKSNIGEISDAELVYCTYTNHTEHIEGTIQRKPRSPPPQDATFILQRNLQQSVQQKDITDQADENNIKAGDMTELKAMLRNLSESDDNYVDDNEKSTNKEKSLKTPPATPLDILESIPEWQRNLVLEDRPKDLKRTSEVLEDATLLDKLLAIEKEAENRNQNEVVFESVEPIHVEPVESSNTAFEINEEITITTKINQGIYIDEHESIKHMLKAISEQSIEHNKEKHEGVIVAVKLEDQHAALELPEDIFDDDQFTKQAVSGKVMQQSNKVYPTVLLKRQLSEGATFITDVSNVELHQQHDHQYPVHRVTIDGSQEKNNAPTKVFIKPDNVNKQKVTIKFGSNSENVDKAAPNQPIKLSVKLNSDHSQQQAVNIAESCVESEQTTTELHKKDNHPEAVIQVNVNVKPIQSNVDERIAIVHLMENITQGENKARPRPTNRTASLEMEEFASDTSNRVIIGAFEDISEMSKTVVSSKTIRKTLPSITDDEELVIPTKQETTECEINFDAIMQEKPLGDTDENINSGLDERKILCAEKLQKEIDLTNQLETTTKTTIKTVTVTQVVEHQSANLVPKADVIGGNFQSACGDINPRIGVEIEDRDERIKQLVQHGESSDGDSERVFPIEQVDVEAVSDFQIEGAQAKDPSRKEQLIKSLLTKMSVQQVPLTIVKDEEKKVVRIAYSNGKLDDIVISSESENEYLEPINDEIDSCKKGEVAVEKNIPENTKVEKLAFAMMSKYRSMDLCNSYDGDNEYDIDDQDTKDIQDEDNILLESVQLDQSGVDISALTRDDSVSSGIDNNDKQCEVHDGLFSDVEKYESEPFSDEEKKLAKNHFFDKIEAEKGQTASKLDMLHVTECEVTCTEIEKEGIRLATKNAAPTHVIQNAVSQSVMPTNSKVMKIIVTAGTPEPNADKEKSPEVDAGEEDYQELVRKDSKTFRKRPKLSASESDADDLKKNIRKSIEVDDKVDITELNDSKPSTEATQHTGAYTVTTFESTEQTVQCTEAYGAVSVQTIKKGTGKSYNIYSHTQTNSSQIHTSTYDFDKTVEEFDDESSPTVLDATITAPDQPTTIPDEPTSRQASQKQIVTEEEEIIPIEHSLNVESAAFEFDDINDEEGTENTLSTGTFEEVLTESHQQLVHQLEEIEAHRNTNGGMNEEDSTYTSACHAINPRLEREISERERRIQELLNRANQNESVDDDAIVETTTLEVCSQPTDLIEEETIQIQTTKDVKSSLQGRGYSRVTVVKREITELIPTAGSYEIPHNTYQSASSNLGPVVNTENLVVPNTPTETRPLNNDEAVTLEIRGDRLIEKGESQKYQDANQYHQVPVTLSSIKLRKPQNITLELRSAGPLIGKQNSMLTHSIDVQKTKTHYSTVTQTQEEVVLQNGGNYHGTSGNQKEVMLIINDHGDSIEPVQARFVEADEELLNLRRKHLPTTSL